ADVLDPELVEARRIELAAEHRRDPAGSPLRFRPLPPAGPPPGNLPDGFVAVRGAMALAGPVVALAGLEESISEAILASASGFISAEGQWAYLPVWRGVPTVALPAAGLAAEALAVASALPRPPFGTLAVAADAAEAAVLLAGPAELVPEGRLVASRG